MLDKSSINEVLKLGYSIKELKNRRIGKSTGLALGFISQALLKPNTQIKVYDHFNSESIQTKRYMLQNIQKLVQDLNLKWFVFNKVNCTIKYDLNKYFKTIFGE